MKLIKQPNRWSCGIASFAMLFDLSIEEAIQAVGHDGSDIWWPEAPEPLCRRGYSVAEYVEGAFHLGYALIQIDVAPQLASPNCEPKLVYPEEILESRIHNIMLRGPGLILGQLSADQWHMVAWDGRLVYDPKEPKNYSFDTVGIEKISIDAFWLKMKIDKSDWATAESKVLINQEVL